MAVRLQRSLALRFSVTMALALMGIALWAFVGVRRALLHQLEDSIETTSQLQSHTLADRGSIIQLRQADPRRFIQDINRLVVVRDSAGQILQSNSSLALDLPFDSEAFGRARAGDHALATGAWHGGEVRSVYVPIIAGGPPSAAVMQVGASLEPLHQASRQVLFRMLGTALLGTLCAMVGSWWLSRSAIAPVKEITAQAQAIQGRVDGQRITAHADVQELKGLIDVLNGMLSRVARTQVWHRRILQDLGHDLRTPITAMRAGMEIALRSDRQPEEYRRVLASTVEDIDRLQLITDALSLLGRLEAGTLKPTHTLLDARLLVDEAVGRASRRLDGRTLEWNQPTEPFPARLDRQLIGKILDQLIDNAIQHTPQGTHITVRLARANDHLVIEVEDNGPGVPAEMLPEMFDRFYRGHESRGRESGAGLGLTTVAAVIDLHQGTVVAQPGPEGGLKIRVELPTIGLGT